MTIDPQPTECHPGGPMPVNEYLQLEESARDARYEYLDGVARLMSGGSVGHDRIARNVAHFTEVHFSSGPCTVFGSDVQVLIGLKANDKAYYVYPDATVSCDVADRRRDNKLIRSPRVVFEVLSPSTEARSWKRTKHAYLCKKFCLLASLLSMSKFIEEEKMGLAGVTRPMALAHWLN